MNLWNMIIPFLTFGAPVSAILFFALRGRPSSDAERRASLLLFGLTFFTALLGMFRFESPVKMEFLLPLATDSSGYFEPSLQLHWIRYAWILLSSAVLGGLAIFDGDSSYVGPRGPLRFLYLAGSFLFISLAFLSENFLLSLMFIEITVFLLHSFSVEMGGAEGQLERVSYFKRNSFIVLGLTAMLFLTAANEFTTNSVVLLGVVLYVMSMILSKHNFSDWRYVPLSIIQAATLFFLLSRVMRDEMSNELWLPLTILFAAATIAFSLLSFLASATLNASFWLVFAVIGYLFFLRFSSRNPNELIWSASEATALFACYALTVLFRFGHENNRAWKKGMAFFFAAALLCVVVGVIPAVNFSSSHSENHDTVFKIVIMGLLSFLLAMVGAKALVVSFHQGKASPTNARFLLALTPAFVAIFMVLGAAIRSVNIYGEDAVAQIAGEVFSDLPLLIRGAALFAGGLAGVVLGSNSRLLAWAGHREKNMEDLFPRIDPVVIRWNQTMVEAPERGLAWMGDQLVAFSSRSAQAMQNGDRRLFAENFPGIFLSYGASLSRWIRFFNSGNIRFYFFFGTALTFIAAALFLLGGA